MAEVKLDQVEKVYPGGFCAIKEMYLEIHDGELMVLVGPSGCGKSTMLRMIAGLEQISSGEIYIENELVNNKEPADRDIAMVFQNYALYPHMSVYDNMAYGLKNRKISKNKIDELVNEVAKTLELDKLLGRKPKALSGGQRQRVAMGRAIVREPKVFLFDEPLSNLDAKLRVQMRLEIKKLQKKLGVTSIYVTHDQVEAMTLGHRLVLLNEGQIEQIGTPVEVYENPQSLFVASFIGSPPMNLMGGVINDKKELVIGNQFCLKSNVLEKTETDSKITVGIRPEHLYDFMGGDNTLRILVENYERQGADSFVYGKIEGCEDLITVRYPADFYCSIGESLKISFQSNNLHYFDTDKGVRID